eukprot:4585915-Prymnesium_polylepis.1
MLRRSGNAFCLLLALTPTACLRLPSRAGEAVSTRRAIVGKAAAVLAVGAGGAAPAQALIKGSAPPPKLDKPKERKCKSIDECEALGEKAKAEASANERTDFERTKG